MRYVQAGGRNCIDEQVEYCQNDIVIYWERVRVKERDKKLFSVQFVSKIEVYIRKYKDNFCKKVSKKSCHNLTWKNFWM